MLLCLFLLLAQTAVQPGVNNVAPDLPAAIQLAQEGRNAEALVALQKIAAANPDDHLARLWIANVQARLGNPDLAEAVYHSIAIEDPRNVDAWIGLGTVLLRQDRVEEGLEALRRAEQLSPQNPNVWAALASGYQLAGEQTQSISYYERLAGASRTPANVLNLENARSQRAHRIQSQTFVEDYNGNTPSTRGEDLALNYRLSEKMRLIGRGQFQRKFARNENRFGGGVQWQWTPWGTFTGQVLAVGDDNRVLPQRDYLGRVDYGYHRATYTGELRYFDFFGANVTMFSPAATIAVTPRWTGSIRYAFTSTETATAIGVQSHTLDLRAAHELRPRVWVRGGFIRGIENFDQFSIDHIGEFRAKTANVGVQVQFPSLTSLVGNYDYQWRANGVHMGRFNISLVQAF